MVEYTAGRCDLQKSEREHGYLFIENISERQAIFSIEDGEYAVYETSRENDHVSYHPSGGIGIPISLRDGDLANLERLTFYGSDGGEVRVSLSHQDPGEVCISSRLHSFVNPVVLQLLSPRRSNRVRFSGEPIRVSASRRMGVWDHPPDSAERRSSIREQDGRVISYRFIPHGREDSAEVIRAASETMLHRNIVEWGVAGRPTWLDIEVPTCPHGAELIDCAIVWQGFSRPEMSDDLAGSTRVAVLDFLADGSANAGAGLAVEALVGSPIQSIVARVSCVSIGDDREVDRCGVHMQATWGQSGYAYESIYVPAETGVVSETLHDISVRVDGTPASVRMFLDVMGDVERWHSGMSSMHVSSIGRGRLTVHDIEIH